jgi:hypothetical protein
MNAVHEIIELYRKDFDVTLIEELPPADATTTPPTPLGRKLC